MLKVIVNLLYIAFVLPIVILYEEFTNKKWKDSVNEY